MCTCILFHMYLQFVPCVLAVCSMGRDFVETISPLVSLRELSTSPFVPCSIEAAFNVTIYHFFLTEETFNVTIRPLVRGNFLCHHMEGAFNVTICQFCFIGGAFIVTICPLLFCGMRFQYHH